ncbi:hypothetical protein ACQ86N_31935 [Puia sp. P3]|uniref:hypothetical protein n=1 Tax=Puia sp. P3 TaxID=3423952 RepID=UPI003D6706D2
MKNTRNATKTRKTPASTGRSSNAQNRTGSRQPGSSDNRQSGSAGSRQTGSSSGRQTDNDEENSPAPTTAQLAEADRTLLLKKTLGNKAPSREIHPSKNSF